MKQKELLSKIDRQAVVDAIARAERRTSGEIRVHIEPRSHGGDLRSVAERTFERLGMTKTERRNGVLLFIAAEENRFVILGDRGIHEKVGQGFWDATAAKISEHFRGGRFTEGIVATVDEIGSLLEEFFPFTAGDVDELSNEISVGGDE